MILAAARYLGVRAGSWHPLAASVCRSTSIDNRQFFSADNSGSRLNEAR